MFDKILNVTATNEVTNIKIRTIKTRKTNHAPSIDYETFSIMKRTACEILFIWKFACRNLYTGIYAIFSWVQGTIKM